MLFERVLLNRVVPKTAVDTTRLDCLARFPDWVS
jgi:hypothetical protein